MNQTTIWKIALPTPLKKLFDYLPPPHHRVVPSHGCRVRVPFGARILIGIFLGVYQETEVDPKKLKTVETVIDQYPIYHENVLQLCHWASEYYHHSLGEVLMSALPKALRLGKDIPNKALKKYELTELGVAQLHLQTRRAKKQQLLLKILRDHSLTDLQLKKNNIARVTLNRVIEKKWVRATEITFFVKNDAIMAENPMTLNEAQLKALQAIHQAKGFFPFLLAGVTGSGKTEVYLQAIEEVLKRRKQALVLVPEISLTPQTLARFQNRFNVEIAVLHSGLSDKERLTMWWQAFQGKALILIGTRSAIFAPLSNLGLIIVDEEHDLSFKSQNQIRYNARDLAVMRGRMENIPVVLGSATPSLESFYNVVQNRYHLLSLPSRVGNSKLPFVRVIDLRDQKTIAGLSESLIQTIRTMLTQNKQVLIFLNRRGFAPMMLCHHCGYTLNCTRCDAKLIYHMNPVRLVCHHCEKIIKPPRICPQCHQTELMTVGQGTEQLEQVLKELFPQNKILRIDRDTTTTRHSLVDKLNQIHAGEADLLIGTQMLAKGHHFPRVGLSAIVDIDNSFFSLDFRAMERMGALLTQVAGRAGRTEEEGVVILQTHQPQHPFLQVLLRKGYFSFMETLLQERKKALLPPYAYQIILRAQAQKRQTSLTFLQAVKSCVEHPCVKTLGPMPALMERKAGHYRSQLILQSCSRRDLKEILLELSKKIAEMPERRRVRFSIDVDPVETL